MGESEEFTVTRTGDDWPSARYKIMGGPERARTVFGIQHRWSEWSWTLRSAKRKIRRRRAWLARTDKVVYREQA